MEYCQLLLVCYLAVSSWVLPQPQYSSGRLVVYGNQGLVEVNARFHHYTLDGVPDRCGLSSISPAHLGQIAWVSVDQQDWYMCRVIDVGGRSDALRLIFGYHEIAEVSYLTAAKMGFGHGHSGFIWFGQCPPSSELTPQPYVPPLIVTGFAGSDYGSLNYNAGYPKQVPASCKQLPSVEEFQTHP